MTIVKTLNAIDFACEFDSMSRTDFTWDARHALFRYLNDLSYDLESPIELDVIDLCCTWTEYDNAVKAAEAYGYESEMIDETDKEQDCLDYLSERTTVITFVGGVLVQNF